LKSSPGEAGITKLCSLLVLLFMADGAKGDQVGVVIVALLAAQLFVMDLQVLP
jgi:hypothetical protein